MARGSGNNKSKRGFASMDAAKRKEIAKKGGKASHGSRKNNQERGFII
jgi:general stress protein YciG